MSIKVSIDTMMVRETYPIIKQSTSTGGIVLFISESTGIVLQSDQYEVGHFSNEWCEEKMVPFNGTITLSN